MFINATRLSLLRHTHDSHFCFIFICLALSVTDEFTAKQFNRTAWGFFHVSCFAIYLNSRVQWFLLIHFGFSLVAHKTLLFNALLLLNHDVKTEKWEIN